MPEVHPNGRAIKLLECCKNAAKITGTKFCSKCSNAAQEAGFKSANDALTCWIDWSMRSNVSWPFFTNTDVEAFKQLDRKIFKGAPELLLAINNNFNGFLVCYAAIKREYDEVFQSLFACDVKKLAAILRKVLDAGETPGKEWKITDEKYLEQHNVESHNGSDDRCDDCEKDNSEKAGQCTKASKAL